jgi:putative phosphoesterase
MKVAVLSDIHSNYYAFKACYEDAVKCGAEMFIFLGDYVSDLSEPQRTMDLVYEIQSKYPTVCLRGNREGYMLDCESGKSSFTRGSKSGSLLFTYEHLRKKDLEFIRGLKISDTIEIEGVRIEIAHAAMNNDRFYFDSNDGHTTDIFPQMKCNYLLTGHSHKQYIRRNAGKTIINPGSVGIPQDSTRNPKYALLNVADGKVSCKFREVAYDMADAIHSQFASGLVECAKYWAIGILYDIITGEEWGLKLLKCVQEADGFYDEKVWHLCAVELEMQFTEQEILAIYQKTVSSRKW